MAAATRGDLIRELRWREATRVALEVPWERQAMLAVALRCVAAGWLRWGSRVLGRRRVFCFYGFVKRGSAWAMGGLGCFVVLKTRNSVCRGWIHVSAAVVLGFPEVIVSK